MILRLLAGWLGAGTAYLVALLAAAAARPRGRPDLTGEPGLRFVVLVPAHDEEGTIGPTAASLVAQDHPAFEVVVVADNCTDATAEEARVAGATVWERDAPDARGKGQALAWALERVFAERPQTGAVAFVDADCLAEPGLLRALDARLRSGVEGVQADYVVSNPEESRESALRYAGFALINSVRPRGKAALGLSAGLYGSGMAFTAGLLHRHPWSAFSIVEDAEYHLRLVQAGERVAFAPETSVASRMPTSAAASASQQSRWESGKVAMVRDWTPKLVARGLRERNVELVHAGAEQLVPPQSLLAAGNAVLIAGGALLRRRGVLATGVFGVLGQAVYVLGGLRLVGAPPAVFAALAAAPRLVLGKVVLYARILRGKGAQGWVRTGRDG